MAIGTPVDLGHNQIATGSASLAITTLAATSAADDIVLFHYCNSSAGTISSISDTAVNAYQVLRLQSTAPLAEMWFAPNAGAMVISSTITANFNGGTTLRHGISAVRVPGMRTSGIVSQFSTTSPTGTAASSGAIIFPALTQPEMLLFVMIATAATPGAITWGSGFTAIGGNTATAFALPAYKIVADAAPVTDAPTWVNSILYRTLGGALPGATQPPLYALDDRRKIYLPRMMPAALEISDVPLALIQDALTPPGDSEAAAMQRMAQRNARLAGAEYVPNLLTTTLSPIVPPGGATPYGVTTGPGMSMAIGTSHANAHGVGGNQKNLSGAEGIPYDLPQ